MKIVTATVAVIFFAAVSSASFLSDLGFDDLPYQCVSCATSCALKGPGECGSCAAAECGECSLASDVCGAIADANDQLPSTDSIQQALDQALNADYSTCSTCSFDCLMDTAYGDLTGEQCNECVASDCQSCGSEIVSMLQRPCEAQGFITDLRSGLERGEACAQCANQCSQEITSTECVSCFESETCSQCSNMASSICK